MKKNFIIPFDVVELEPDNLHIVASAEINGTPFNVVLDTGASHTCFDLDFIKNLNPNQAMEQNDGLNVGIGSEFESQLATIENFKLGDFVVDGYNVVLLDMSNINSVYEKMDKPLIHCILGSDFFVRFKAVIDYKKREMKISSK